MANGSWLAGRYALGAELGRGVSGRVFAAVDHADGDTPRALKLVGREQAARLSWELSALSRVAHPNLARVYELLRVERSGASPELPEGGLVLVSELAEGRAADLVAAQLRRDPPALLRFVLAVAHGVSRALSALHAAGLTHGDVKPANIVVKEDLTSCKLIDLGLAHEGSAASAQLAGTPAYMAPEVFRGERGPSADLFALGVTLHELLRGAPESAARSASLAEHFARALRAPAVREALPESTPPALERLVASMLEPEPEARPKAAGEIAARVLSIAEDRGLALQPSAGGFADAAPSTAELAGAIGVLPLVGHAAALDALAQAFAARERLIVVYGPRGSGRSRLVREAVRRLQLAVLAAEAPVPTYTTRLNLPSAAQASHSVLHIESADSLSAEAASAFLRAAELDDHHGWLVLERVAPLGAESAIEIALQPLPEGELRRLLERALPGVRVSAGHMREALATSAGLSGRLCRTLAQALASGADMSRPQSLHVGAELVAGVADSALAGDARALLELLVVAGGELEPSAAARALGPGHELTPAYRTLLLSGVATLTRTRLCLRADLLASERARLTPERLLGLAGRLSDAELDGRARAYVKLAQGKRALAFAEFAAEIGRLRADGKPEHAALCAREALHADLEPSSEPELRWQWADALRAQGLYLQAEAALGAVRSGHALVLRAELARLRGDASVARELAAAAADAGDEPGVAALARAVLARLHYDAGELDQAVALAQAASSEEPSPRGQALSNAYLRAQEVLALVQLHRGELEPALQRLRPAIERAASARERVPESRLRALLGQLERERGDAYAAARHYTAAFELADAAGEQHAAAAFLHNVGVQQLDCGEPGPAINALRAAARRLARLGRESDLARVLYNLGLAAQLIGQDDLALTSAERAYDAALVANDRTTQAYATCLSAEQRLKLGERRAAAQLLARPIELSVLPVQARASVAARICALQLALGEPERAREALAEAERAVESAGSDAAELELWLATCQCELERGRAEQAQLAAERGYALAQRGASFDARLRAALAAARAARASGDGALSALRFSEVRSMLDQAARSLAPAERAQLRAVDGYRAALEALPSQTAIAAAPGRDERWRALSGVAKRLTAERREPRLHEIVLDAALELTAAERGYIVLKDHAGQPRVRAARGIERRHGDAGEPSFSRSIVARVLGAGRPLRTMDAAHDVELSAAASVHALALRSVLAAPLRIRGEVVGAIYLEDRLRPFAFGELEQALIADLCELASIAFESARLLRAERRNARQLAVLRARLARRVEAQAVELEALKRVHGQRGGAAHGMIGHSPAMQRVAEMIGRVAQAAVPVLITGESGTGKELVARAIHDSSARKGAPFVSENCGAIPEALLESALFGHVRGAFTGADRRRLGLFEVADGGTLFLDEIGEMTQAMQARLLRVLEDGEVRPLGGERARRVDVRVLCATHRDLPAMVAAGRFREDLYYRLAVMTLSLPSLRERSEDIPALTAHFIEKYGAGRPRELDKRALLALSCYAWPGNVRQLENEVRRALVLSDGVIMPEHLSHTLSDPARGPHADPLDLRAQVDQLERKLIRQALDAVGGNQTQAARKLGVSRYGLQKMIRRLELSDTDYN